MSDRSRFPTEWLKRLAGAKAGIALAVLGLGAAALVGGVFTEPVQPLAEEATSVMMSESLLQDGDLLYAEEDSNRAQQRWRRGPQGLRLAAVEGGTDLGFAESAVYPLLTLPFFAAFGRQGLVLANAIFFVLTWAALAYGVPDDAKRRSLWLVTCLAGSLVLAYVFVAQAEALLMACLAWAVGLWMRDGASGARMAGCGLLLGVALAAEPVLGVVLASIALDCCLGRRWRSLALLMVFAALAAAGLVGAELALGGDAAAPFGGRDERIFVESFPEGPDRAARFYHDGVSASAALRSPRRLLTEAWYFLVGRFSGIAAYYPATLLALGAFVMGATNRKRGLLAAAILLLAAAAVWSRTGASPGEAGLLGNRGFAVLAPLLAFLPSKLPRRRWMVLPLVAASLWALPAVATVARARSSIELSRFADRSVARWLPAELTRLADGERRGYRLIEAGGLRWATRISGFYPREDLRGIWGRGDTTTEIWLVTRFGMEELTLELRSVTPGGVARVLSNRETVEVRFDSLSRRSGTPVTLALEPSGSDLSTFFGRERFYRLLVVSEGGTVFPRPGRGGERWFLGTYIDLEAARR